jgi:hypothetical protein
MTILFEDFSYMEALLYLEMYICSVFNILLTKGAFWLKLLQEQIEKALPEAKQQMLASTLQIPVSSGSSTLHYVLPRKSPLYFANLV